MSTKSNSFKAFHAKYVVLTKLSENFALLWEKYKLILARCPVEYIEHYCKCVLSAKDYILCETLSMLKNAAFSDTTDVVENLQLTDIRAHLNKISVLMKEKIGKLGNVMYSRSKLPPNGMGDIRYNSCVFDLLFGQVTIIASNKNKVLLSYSSSESDWLFKPPRDQTESINSLIISTPSEAPNDYNHSELFLTSGGVVDNNNVLTAPDYVSGEVEAFNKQNGLGSRQSQSFTSSASKRRRAAASGFNMMTPSTTTTSADASHRTINLSSPTSGGTNTTTEEFTGSSKTSSLLFTMESETSPLTEPLNNSNTNSSAECEDHIQPSPSYKYSPIDQLINSTRGTPERTANVNSLALVVRVPETKAVDDDVTPYNFDDETKNNQPKFSSSFLNGVDDGGSDSEDNLVGSRKLANKMKVYAKTRSDARRSSAAAQQDVSSSEESIIDENASDSEFFVPDGTYEGVHPESAFRARVDKSLARSKPPLKKGGMVDEEFNTSSDEEVKRFKVQKSASSTLLHGNKRKTKHRASTNNTISKRHAAVTDDNHRRITSKQIQPHLSNLDAIDKTLASQDSAMFSKVLKSVVLKKRTRDDYKPNPLEDLSMHVTNAVRITDDASLLSSHDDNDFVADNSPESLASLKSQNKTLDRKMVLFLVKDCTTRIGADIGLECCIMDYLCKKQTINRVTKMEQQRIDNLEELFLNIERLISNEIKLEHEKNHNVLERAHQRTKRSIVMKCIIKQSCIQQQSDISDSDKLAAEDTLKKTEKELVDKLARIATEAKAFNQQACRFSLRKVNSTLHYVCGKFCAVWLEANNCIGDISPELLRHYNSRAERDAASIKQLISATKNGVFLLDCDLELADGVETRGSPEEQQAEETELRRILDSDHVESVQNTIKAIADDSDRIKRLIQIVWTKETRVKLSHTIAKAKKKEAYAAAEVTASTNISTSPAIGTTTKILTPIATSITNGISIANSVRFAEEPLQVAQSLESAAVGSRKITSFYGVNPHQSPSEMTRETGSYRANQIMLAGQLNQRQHSDKFASEPQSSLTKIAQTFDKAFLLVTGRIQAVSTTQCLELTVKSRSIEVMLLRLRLLHFLLLNKSKEPSEVLSLLQQRVEMYDLFDCFFLMRGSNLSASNTGSDGYCMTRGQHQLCYRAEHDFKTTVTEMRALDKACNSASVDNTNAAFITFIKDLPSLMKTKSKENETLIGVMGELAYFKRMKQLEIMPALLSVRPPGTPLSALFWGELQTVTMLGFNATAFSTLVGTEFMEMIPKLRCNWIKYEASSVPKSRSPASLKKSKRPLSEIDQVLSEDLNIMVYAASHCFVCDNPGPIKVVLDIFNDLKASAIEELLARIALIEVMTPDVLYQLANIISNSESKSQSVDYDYFDFATFEKTFARKFPHGVMDCPLVDLTDEPEEGETDREIYKLKQALDLSNAKLKIVEDYSLELRQSCLLSKPNEPSAASSSLSL